MKLEMQHPARWATLRFFVLLLAAWVGGAPGRAAAGVFIPMATTQTGPSRPGHMLLLPDGRVMVQQAANTNWFFLNPDLSGGNYFDGVWSNCPPMNFDRLYYASAVLPSGRVFIAGGEYNNDDPSPTNAFGLPAGGTAELFDPQANGGAGAWTFINPPTSLFDPSAGDGFFDAESVVLSTGNVLVAPVHPGATGGTLIYHPSDNSWTAGGTVDGKSEDEASWVKLPDNSILTIDPHSSDCQRYLPDSNTWIEDVPVPVDLYSTNGEIGAAMLLTNGTALYFGGNNTNTSRIYTPSPLGGTNWGSWSPGPKIPQGRVMRDAPACNLNNGKLLLTFVDPSADKPFYIYEYNVDSGAFNLVLTDSNSISDGSSLLQLPDGNVLFDDSRQMLVYQPDPAPIAAGRPTIYSVSWNSDGSLHLTGTLFNGISQGAMYGDDAQQDSNYPLVRFTGGGNVYYGRSYNWSSTGVRTGGEVVSTEVVVPAAVLDFPAAYTVQVVANGNASAGVGFDSPVWVDFSYVSANNFYFGWYDFPYDTLASGVANVASGGTIAIKSSSMVSSETLTINKPMTIISVGGPSTIGN